MDSDLIQTFPGDPCCEIHLTMGGPYQLRVPLQTIEESNSSVGPVKTRVQSDVKTLVRCLHQSVEFRGRLEVPASGELTSCVSAGSALKSSPTAISEAWTRADGWATPTLTPGCRCLDHKPNLIPELTGEESACVPPFPTFPTVPSILCRL